MVGISGTGKGGEKHYYYSCQKHRLEHTCEKKNVSRDFIEDAVCRGVVDYVLQDYVIEWMADCVIDYQNRHKYDGTINILTAQKKKVDASIKNILNAMEHGVFTSSTKARLEELEQEQAKLSRSIETEKALHPTHTRARVVYWLEQFRGGDINDPAYRENIVRIFVNAIYLYDDGRIKIALNFAGDNSTVDLSFIENVDNYDAESVRISLKELHHVEMPVNGSKSRKRDSSMIHRHFSFSKS